MSKRKQKPKLSKTQRQCDECREWFSVDLLHTIFSLEPYRLLCGFCRDLLRKKEDKKEI